MTEQKLLINSYDAFKAIDPKVALEQDGSAWWVIKDHKKIGGWFFEGNLPDKSDAGPRPFKTFPEAVKKSGHKGDWKRPQGKYMGGYWYPASLDVPDLRVRVGDDGKSKPLKWNVGKPCQWLRYRTYGHGCEAVAIDGDTMCKRHRSSTDRADMNEAERQAESAAWQERWRRDAQAGKRAEEILKEITPALEQLGHRADTLSINGGHIGMPAEALKALVDAALELDDIKGL